MKKKHFLSTLAQGSFLCELIFKNIGTTFWGVIRVHIGTTFWGVIRVHIYTRDKVIHTMECVCVHAVKLLCWRKLRLNWILFFDKLRFFFFWSRLEAYSIRLSILHQPLDLLQRHHIGTTTTGGGRRLLGPVLRWDQGGSLYCVGLWSCRRCRCPNLARRSCDAAGLVFAAAVVLDGCLNEATDQLRGGHEATDARAQTDQKLGEGLAVLGDLKREFEKKISNIKFYKNAFGWN